MNGIVSFRLCSLSDMDLLDAVDSMTDEMYKQGKIPSRHIPARPNQDYDLLVGELILRYLKNCTHSAEEVDYKEKYDKCISIIKRFDAGIIGMYDL